MNLRTLALFLVMASMAQSSHAEVREWTNADGRTVKAEYGGRDDTTVTLVLANGKKSRVPLASLSAKDRAHVARLPRGGSRSGDNFDAPWPKEARVSDDYEVEVIKDGPDEYIYETPHFRFVCDAKIGRTVIKTVSEMFEATYEANKALPLNNLAGREAGGKFPAFMYEKKEDYLKAGGLPGSAGVCFGPTQEYPLGRIFVMYRFLGVRKVGGTYILDRTGNSSTLRHELTHQMMDVMVKRNNIWFVEGSAEYVAQSPYRNGRYNFTSNKNSIVQFVTGYDKKSRMGRGLGKNLSAPSLKHFMTMSQAQFCNGFNANFNYGLAPLIVYYFYHADGKGDAARMRAYNKALQNGSKRDEALDILLDGRSWGELAAEIAAYWKKSGITITFKPTGTEPPSPARE